MKSYDGWEPIIGLEIHVELNTKTKLFSRAPNRFGDEPNTNITEVCTGQPGSLPLLNKEAVRKAVLFGTAVNGRVARYSRFDRKSYFYPDLPKNFQITQYEMPIVSGGEIIADVDGEMKTFHITRAHLEEDAGMLKHFPNFAGVDYNRAGVPLIEIVSEPCIFSSKEAVAYAMGVKAILQYLDVSDCNMEEGSLRFDANISVRRKGEKGFRNKIEIKNMNSFNFLQLALESEIKRQINAYEQNPHKPPSEVITPSTFRWNTEKKETQLMRKKEGADDYRYFPEPDLLPLILEEEYIDSIRRSLPELPYEREKRYIQTLNLNPATASILVNEKKLSDYYEMALKHSDNAKSVANWLIGEFAGRFKESGKEIWLSPILPEHVGKLVHLIDSGKITGKIAKLIADEMVSTGKEPEAILAANPSYQPLFDEAALTVIVERVIEENSESVNAFNEGKTRAFGFLVGQVMQATEGKASPKIVNDLIKSTLEKKRVS